MTPFEQLQYEARLIPVGESARIVCPKCQDPERSLSIRQTTDGPHWKCFRAKCGYTGGPRGVRNEFAEPVLKSPRYYTGRTRTLGRTEQDFLNEKFGFIPTLCSYA